MNMLPVIQRYIDASNAHDVNAIIACFSDDAVVREATWQIFSFALI
jgi:hypothetical protein